jgi:hypothetical protein
MATPKIVEDTLFKVLCLGVSRLQNWALQYIFYETFTKFMLSCIVKEITNGFAQMRKTYKFFFLFKFLYPLALIKHKGLNLSGSG